MLGAARVRGGRTRRMPAAARYLWIVRPVSEIPVRVRNAWATSSSARNGLSRTTAANSSICVALSFGGRPGLPRGFDFAIPHLLPRRIAERVK